MARLSRRQGARHRDAEAAHPQGGPSRSPSFRCCAARPSRTRACSRCSTRSSTICLRRSIAARSRASTWTPARKSLRLPQDSEPFSMLGFKIMDDPFVGTITFCRVYSGKIESGTTVLNSTKDKRERVGRMLLMHANNREDIKEAYSGDIVALAGLKDTRTGDTLCDLQKPVILEKMEFPEPVIEIAIEPKSKADQEKLGVALGQARRRGPVVPRLDRSGIRPDHPEGNGRTASRHQGRHPAPHLQGRRQYRRAAGRLSREADQADRDQLHPQEADRRHRPVRQGDDRVRAGGAGRRVRRSNPRSSAARCPRNISPASKRASTA